MTITYQYSDKFETINAKRHLTECNLKRKNTVSEIISILENIKNTLLENIELDSMLVTVDIYDDHINFYIKLYEQVEKNMSSKEIDVSYNMISKTLSGYIENDNIYALIKPTLIKIAKNIKV